MDALEFIKERNRMCRSFSGSCNGCPADKNICCSAFAWQEELVAIVEKWSKENPRMTRQSEFLKQYPYANRIDGVVAICPKMVDVSFSCPIDTNISIDCFACKHEFWMQEVE